MNVNADDAAFMATAIRLAERGRYTCAPNPAVGCVVVREGCIVGQGFHERAGEPHAEVIALAQAAERARGSTLYVTLEPCCHTGRTGPCTEVLQRADVHRVVVAMEDPNPLVSGAGVRILRDAGIQVELGLMAEAAAEVNRGFISRMRRGRPFVRLKIAASLDGGTALADGTSQWITGPAARRDVQRLRAASSMLVTGIGTVLADDPQLTVRDPDVLQHLGPKYRVPGRAVIDTALRMTPSARLLQSPGEVLIFCADSGTEAEQRVRALNNAGATVIPCPKVAQGVDLDVVLAQLAAREINDVLVEAGAELTGSFMAAGLVDELVIYQSPCFLGHTTRRMAQWPALDRLSDRLGWVWTDVRQVGEDLRIIARRL